MAEHGTAFHSCKGRSEHGGRHGTVVSLIKRKILAAYGGPLTVKGYELYAELTKPQA